MVALDRMTRRGFVTSSLGGAAAWFAAQRVLAMSPAPRQEKVVASEPFADVVELGDKVWGIISKREDRKTLCNGGIVAGAEGVLAIEGYMTPEGAAWASELAEKLAGRRPAHVIVTHVHPDHTYGLAGYLAGPHRPQIIMSAATRKLFLERQLNDDSRTRQGAGLVAVGGPYVIPDAVIVAGAEPTVIDLGGRKVNVVERAGHTPSDLTLELDSPRLTWTGDLVFHGMFPFFGDAIPTKLKESVKALLSDTSATFIPGHGPAARASDLAPYVELLDHVEAAARAAMAAGKSASEAAKEYKLPESQRDLYIFNPQVFTFAFEAWYRELKPKGA